MKPIDILKTVYADSPQLLDLLLIHGRMVGQKALEIADRCPELSIDRDFVIEAALLHDIGIRACNAPSIGCFGNLPYVQHGVEGRRILEEFGLLRHALVCERHVAMGIDLEEIHERQIPLPDRDMLPITIEERLICFADKFFSKDSNPEQEKPVPSILKGLSRYGEKQIKRFLLCCELFRYPIPSFP
ncbi:MAG: HD domain-containing protein [Thermodesulfobacteriota bacterium]